MNLFYQFAYFVGFKPWETAQRRSADLVAGLFDREERERIPPFGAVLDLGCGTGIQAITLAKRGWTVTGIDLVDRALRAARRRAEDEGAAVRFLRADVTNLRASGLEPGFQLLLDFGCFHGLTDDQRRAMGREVSALAAPSATLLLFAFKPGRRGPAPRGASRDDIEAGFTGWRIIDEEIVPAPNVAALKKSDPRIYRLRFG